MSLSQLSNFSQRLMVGPFTSAIILCLVYWSHLPAIIPVFSLVLASITGAALWEFFQLAKAKGTQPQEWLGVIASTAYVIAVIGNRCYGTAFEFPEVVLVLALLVSFATCVGKKEPMRSSATTMFGLIYITLPLSYLAKINYIDLGSDSSIGHYWLIYTILVTKLTDTGAYTSGKLLGKRKLAPILSPNKTVEGAVGGAILGIITSLTFSFFLKEFSILQALCLGALMACLAISGDLVESLLKRDAGVKDSNQVPGLGGALDVMDSLIFTAPTLYFFLKMWSPTA